jgi:hypothetical protein
LLGFVSLAYWFNWINFLSLRQDKKVIQEIISLVAVLVLSGLAGFRSDPGTILPPPPHFILFSFRESSA